MRLVESFSSVYSNPSYPSQSCGKLIFSVSVFDGQSSCKYTNSNVIAHCTKNECDCTFSAKNMLFGSLRVQQRQHQHEVILARDTGDQRPEQLPEKICYYMDPYRTLSK